MAVRKELSLLALTATLGVVGCNTVHPPSEPAGASSSSETDSKAAAPGGACALVSQVQVAAALGVPVDPGRLVNEGVPTSCVWRKSGVPEGPAPTVLIDIVDLAAFDQMKARARALDLGLGDEAFFAKTGRFPIALWVRKGTHYLRIMARTQANPPNGIETADDADMAVETKLAHDILNNL